MLQPTGLCAAQKDTKQKKMVHSTSVMKRHHSLSPVIGRSKSVSPPKATGRSKSMSTTAMKKSHMSPNNCSEDIADAILQPLQKLLRQEEEKNPTLPPRVLTRMSRMLAIKKREFLKMRKNLIAQQNSLLEYYASLKELECRISGSNTEDLAGDIRVLSMKGWPAHDLLLLVRDDVDLVKNLEVNSLLGSHILQQISSRISSIPEEVLAVYTELTSRRLELLDMLKCKHRTDRATYCTNLDWKSKNATFETETQRLHQMVTETTDSVKSKVLTALQLAKIPWIDRDTILKKLERTQKENIILQNKVDELNKNTPNTEKTVLTPPSTVSASQSVTDELANEHAACEKLKEVVASAENMLRAARARIATLERQLKDVRTELDSAKKKQKEMELLYRTRETSFDARSKKLLEVSKTGEITIETLSRQRDALEIRVKELREQMAKAEQASTARDAMQQSRIDALQVKVVEQEKCKSGVDVRVEELQAKVQELENFLQAIRERSNKLDDIYCKRCLEYAPVKEKEPTDKEKEIWKELQATRAALRRAEDQLRQSRVDKDNFLNSLARLAQGEGQGEGSQNLQEKIALELLAKEQEIVKLKRSVEEHEDNRKSMEEHMTQYENQLAELRFEVRRWRHYECFAKDVKIEDLEAELLDLNMQIATLNQERSALVSATASRALMLERYERSTALFANMIRVRKELRALFDGRSSPQSMDETKSEISRSISSICVNAADTWSALRAERVRVMRLEAALLTQRLQLERHGQVRTLLEQQRAVCERIVAVTTKSHKLIHSGQRREGGVMASSAARATYSYP